MDYLNRLKNKLIEKGYGVRYQKTCIDYASSLIRQDLPVIFDKEHLSLVMGIDQKKLGYYIMNSDNFYKEYSVQKSNGGTRVIIMPSLHLKEIQRWILDNILYRYSINDAAYGFVLNRNIKDNAMIHINQSTIVNLDIKNFFPTINYERVFSLFFKSGYTKEVSFILAKLCTYKGILPQGAPSSPYIANILCNRLDKRISGLVAKKKYKYSRYADDITISGDKEINNLVPYIIKIISSEHFEVNLNKLRVQDTATFKEVTGLIVNDTVKVKRKFKKKLEQHIYYCEKFGVYSHLKKIDLPGKSYFREYLYGMANFIKMIEPEVGNGYLLRLDNIAWG